MTHSNEYTNKLISDIRNAQQTKYNAKHEAVIASSPWIRESVNAYRNATPAQLLEIERRVAIRLGKVTN
jgi:hypothetical protein